MHFFPSFRPDTFFLIADTEASMTKQRFPVSSHAKVARAMYSFCCL